MNMKLKGSLILILAMVSISVFSQRWKLTRYEVLFGIGSTNIYGDIGGTADANNLYGLKDIRISETRYSLYTGIRYKIQKDLALKFNLIYGRGIGNDANSKNAEYRGYSFKTGLLEPSFQLEYSFLSEERRLAVSKLFNRKGMVNNFSLISAYGFAGIGSVFYFPKLDLHGSSPIPNTEFTSGYSKFSLAIPFGLGLKYVVNKSWSIGFEFGRRIVFSDYLDGISTKYSKANDTYYFGLFQATYRLKTNRQGVPVIFAKRFPGRFL
jgi:hypothetical protein